MNPLTQLIQTIFGAGENVREWKPDASGYTDKWKQTKPNILQRLRGINVSSPDPQVMPSASPVADYTTERQNDPRYANLPPNKGFMPSQGQVMGSYTPTVEPVQSPVASSKPSMARNPAVSRFNIPQVVHSAIEQAATRYGIPTSLLYDIALQESSFNPTARAADAGFADSTAAGLFMFNDPTWDTVKKYAGMPGSSLQLPSNPNKMDPYLSALAAAYLISKGQLGRWDESKGVWGPHYSSEELEPYYTQTLGR